MTYVYTYTYIMSYNSLSTLSMYVMPLVFAYEVLWPQRAHAQTTHINTHWGNTQMHHARAHAKVHGHAPTLAGNLSQRHLNESDDLLLCAGNNEVNGALTNRAPTRTRGPYLHLLLIARGEVLLFAHGPVHKAHVRMCACDSFSINGATDYCMAIV